MGELMTASSPKVGNDRSGRSSGLRPMIVVGATAALALLGAACAGGTDDAQLLDQASGVRQALSCNQLEAVTRGQLNRLIDAGYTSPRILTKEPPMPIPTPIEGDRSTEQTRPDEAGPQDSSAIAPEGQQGGAVTDSPAGGRVVAGTNVQEGGVDEADIVKTDGRRIVTVTDAILRVVDLDGSPRLDGTLPLGDDQSVAQLFLRDDEALVVTDSSRGHGYNEGPTRMPKLEERAPGQNPEPASIPFQQAVTLIRVDLSDPGTPREIQRSTVEGSLVAARMIDGVARVVTRSQPELIQELWNAASESDARRVVAGLTADELLPRVEHADGEVAMLGACGDVAVLPEPTDARSMSVNSSTGQLGPSTVSVLTVGTDLDHLAPSSVQGMADVIYASADAMYVTSGSWQADGPATTVYRFRIEGRDPAGYTGSGTLPGTVLNQYSLSESAGNLRVVSTVEGTNAGDGQVGGGPMEPALPGEPNPDKTNDAVPVPSTEGRLTVLRPLADGGLAEVGHVDDLGQGETVQSVRYVGDTAYVVTFRQTDPLYAIDLSDPTRPRVLGALKVTGFSQYLHPLGNHLLLGLGREATESGSDTGFKVSLFDATDPTAPVELDRIVIPDGWSTVADDPHAFTWDPVAEQAIFPIEQAGMFEECGPGQVCATSGPAGPTPPGALVIRVKGRSLEKVGEIHHDISDPSGVQLDPWNAQIERSLVVDRDLWTLSRAGLGRSNADSPTTVELIRF